MGASALGIKAEVAWVFDKFRDPAEHVYRALRRGAVMDAVKRHVDDGMWDGPKVVGREISRDRATLFAREDVAVGNLGLNEGLQTVIELIAAISAPDAWSSAKAYVGTGTSTQAAAATDTGLVGTAVYKAMDGTFPSRSSQTMKHRGTFGSSDANQAWEEYSLSNASSNSGSNLQRKVESKGTKGSGETWTLEIDNTFS